MSKSKLESLFWAQLMRAGLPMPEPEFKFHSDRRWRVDFAWPGHRLAVEIEGGIWTGGRHTRGSGFRADMEKYNALSALGWRLLRFDGDGVRSGAAARYVEAVLLLDARNAADYPRGPNGSD
ncbi:MAG: endonuclease domain-containing protein [Labedaea sp.]|jgi:very-short-patch-repair endonuclease